MRSYKYSKRRLFIASLLLIGVVTGSLMLVFGTRTPGFARLVLPRYPLDLGEGKAGKIVDGTFEIRNGGLLPLSFEITPSCGCSEMRPTSGILGPRESRSIFVGVRLGSEESKTVYATIQSNDASRPSAVYLISASCPAPIQTVPSRIDFGRFVPVRSLEAVVRVTGPKGGPLKDPESLAFVSTNAQFRVERAGFECYGCVSPRFSLLFPIARAILLLVSILSAGCDAGKNWQGLAAPPFKMGNKILSSKPPEPLIEMIHPDKDLITSKPSAPLICEVQLILTEGGDLPIHLIATFRDSKGNEAGSEPLDPLRKDGDRYFFRSTLQTPPKPGKYRLFIESCYWTTEVPSVQNSGDRPRDVEFRWSRMGGSVVIKN